jgi:hypothetical protein
MSAMLMSCLAACSHDPQTRTSPSFRLAHDQVARLTVQHKAFCSGLADLRASLLFADESGRALAKKEVVLRCGESAQLDMRGEGAPTRLLAARLDFRAPKSVEPVAAVEVITLGAPGRESSVKYALRGQAED